jgi:hypothetical protein
MPDVISSFTERLFGEWLPSFCDAPHRKDYRVEGFRAESLRPLTRFDAFWFLTAVDAGLVTESQGFLLAPANRAREQLFWSGSKAVAPRSFTLWMEPIITIGALARLNKLHGWPAGQLGTQFGRSWAMDLVVFDEALDRPIIVGEIKKSVAEVKKLLRLMSLYAAEDAMPTEPTRQIERNAYRKVTAIREAWPDVLWVVGPAGHDHVLRIRRTEAARFVLVEEGEGGLAVEMRRAARV